jgi:hypothetical protein
VVPETAASKGMLILELVCGYGVCLLMALLAVTLLLLVWKGRIDLSGLITEANGSASVSRFQLVIFTMVIGLALFVLTMKDGKFPIISNQVLLLLGISASTYAVGKGISFTRPEGVTSPGERALQGKQEGDTVKDLAKMGAPSIATPAGVASGGAPQSQAGP